MESLLFDRGEILSMKKKEMVGSMVGALALMIGLCACEKPVQSTQVTVHSQTKETEESTDAPSSQIGDTQENQTPEEKAKVTPLVVAAEGVFDYIPNDQTEEEWDSLMYLRVDSFLLYENAYEALADALQKNYEEADADAKRVRNYAMEFIQEGEEPENPWSYESKVNIQRADTGYVSFFRNVYSYIGGVHPSYYSWGYTYDTATGKKITLQDIAVDYDKLQECIVDELSRNALAEQFNEDWEEVVRAGLSNPDSKDIAWALSSGSLKMVINCYVIGPYAMGEVSVDLPFEQYGDLIQTKYQPMVDNRVVNGIANGFEYACDFDGDGSEDLLKISTVQEEEYLEKVIVTLGEHSISVDTDCGLNTAYVMYTKSAKPFLYLETKECNDYRNLHVIDLSDAKAGPKEVGVAEGSFYQFVPQDSGCFYLSNRLEVMGSRNGYHACSIGEDGMPVPYENGYRVLLMQYDNLGTTPYALTEEQRFTAEGGCLTLKQEVEALCMEEPFGQEKGTYETLPVGTKLSPYYAEGRTRMTFLMENGRYAVLEYDETEDDWMRIIRGVEEEELLDGIMYAG